MDGAREWKPGLPIDISIQVTNTSGDCIDFVDFAARPDDYARFQPWLDIITWGSQIRDCEPLFAASYRLRKGPYSSRFDHARDANGKELLVLLLATSDTPRRPRPDAEEGSVYFEARCLLAEECRPGGYHRVRIMLIKKWPVPRNDNVDQILNCLMKPSAAEKGKWEKRMVRLI